MKVAGRFKPCAHMGCFDLEVFVELNQRSRKASNKSLFKIFCVCVFFFFFGSPLIAVLCFDQALDSMQWQCPICLKNYSLENIIIDPYFNRVASKV